MINLRQTLRSLARTPTVTAIAILSLALGVGVNAAIFTVFEQLLLRPLPVEEPDRLVNLTDPGPRSGSVSTGTTGDSTAVFSYPMFRDLEGAESAFSGLAAHVSFTANLSFEGQTASGGGALVSGSYFEVLGLDPAHGRLIGPQDDVTPGAHPVVVLAHAYWRGRFAADPAVVGETLRVNGLPMTIIGVAPRGFSGTTLGRDPKVFAPLTMRGQMMPGWEGFDNRKSYWAYLFARLAPGMTLAQAEEAINVPFRALVREVELPLQDGMSESALQRFENKEIVLEPGFRGQSVLHAQTRTPLLVLLAVTAFVLLIAGANVVNLLLIRATARAGEIAVRLSVGARRRHIIAQLLAESFVLAIAGSLVGFLFAHGTLELLVSLLPADLGPGFDFAIGRSAWLFVAALTALTGLVGLFPAFYSTRGDLVASLKSQAGKSSASRSARRFHLAMATVQIALSMALLISAGLFTRSLLNISRIDLGIDIEHLATFGISPELNGYPPERSRAFFERLEEELAVLPGVSAVSASMVPLLADDRWGANVAVQGFTPPPEERSIAFYNAVGPDYFRTLGMTLHAGREFTPQDALGRPKVVIVNETFARKFELGRDVVGKRMRVGGGEELDLEIVGLAADSKYSGVKDETPPLFFLPYRQQESLGAINFYVRTAAEPEQLLPALRRTVAGLDPNLPVEKLRTMRVQVGENLAFDRLISLLSALFAILATLLAAIGLYGVLAYSVGQRRHEIGLRMALGADAGRVRGLVLGQVGRITLIGAAIGLLAALAVGRVASSLLYGLESHDVGVLASASLILTAVAYSAGFLPAQRAASIDPMRALREE